MLPMLQNGSCADVLKVLADQTRLAVVERLLDGPRHVGEINAALHLDPSLLSHHLRVLREAGLVTAKRDGKAVLYQLAREVLAARKGKGINLGCCFLSFE